jgi:LytR cell envelope-related transcriptional attenuator
MEFEELNDKKTAERMIPTSSSRSIRLILNAVIVFSLFGIGYFSSAFFSRNVNATNTGKGQAKAAHIIQLDVLNGCGANGAAAKFTGYLRGAGFDVVEMKNYKVSNLTRTLVVDRIGNLVSAQLVASALGVSDKNIVQQINPDYFVEVSVIIGGDYLTLRPMH